jgi:hypothetical protein|tara:strand:- start:261 stop:398 length:138 start_codon:yes stop_codon:yes gene_type:complete
MKDLKKDSKGEKNRSNDATESLSADEIVKQHFKRKKIEDSQNTHF